MHIINSLGQPCPIPIVKTKQAIAGLPEEGGSVQILVDNQVSCENLAKLAAGEGYAYTVEQQPAGHYSVVLTIGARETGEAAAGSETPHPPEASAPTESPALPAPLGGGLVVAIGGNSMGRGSEELGQILIKGFIFSLCQLEQPPDAIVFFNSGVKLTAKDSSALEDLRDIATRGTRVMSCGACVNYYSCEVAAGEVANMYDIVELMSGANKLINM